MFYWAVPGCVRWAEAGYRSISIPMPQSGIIHREGDVGMKRLNPERHGRVKDNSTGRVSCR